MMKPSVDSLLTSYPNDTLELRDTWQQFRSSINLNDYQWRNGFALSGAANRLARRIEGLRQDLLGRVATNFRLGMASLLLTLAMGVALVRRLSQSEMRVYAQAKELSDRQARLESANRRLGKLANHDDLTGLHNHRAFQERLKEEHNRAKRFVLPLSVLMVDVDKFKQLNDKHGHVAGDEVLREVASVLKDACRKVDFVARYGGEEFVVILPHTAGRESLVMAERLRAAVATSTKVTVSVGAATYELDAFDTAELLSRADLAMYESKRKGRNRVAHFDDISRPEVAVIEA